MNLMVKQICLVIVENVRLPIKRLSFQISLENQGDYLIVLTPSATDNFKKKFYYR